MGRMLRDSLRVPVGLVCNAVGGTPIESWIDRPMLEEYYPQVLRHWKNNDFMMDWVRGRAAKNLARRPGGRHPYHPAYCFETGIEPLLNLPLRGVAWYQGESNAHNPDSWRFDLLARSWRMRMGDFSLPVLRRTAVRHRASVVALDAQHAAHCTAERLCHANGGKFRFGIAPRCAPALQTSGGRTSRAIDVASHLRPIRRTRFSRSGGEQ